MGEGLWVAVGEVDVELAHRVDDLRVDASPRAGVGLLPRAVRRRARELHDELVANPGDLAAKVRFITLYHLVLEATLGLTTFKFVTDYLNGEGLLPGFVEGYSKIHHDETRHIGYGVWFLRETVRDHPEQAETVRETLRRLLPPVAESLKPPGDGNGSGELLGVTQEEISEFALGGLTRRLKLIDVPLETVFS